MTINKIRWERDESGGSAFVSPVENNRIILFGAADNLIKNLMHGVRTISADFDQYGLVVFGSMFQVSIFDKENAKFYGLYASSRPSSLIEPNFCLRQVRWKRSYKTLENILKNIESKTFFFNKNTLSKNDQCLINSIDCVSKNNCDIIYTATLNDIFLNKTMHYCFDNNNIELSCSGLQTISSHNPFIEKTYIDLNKLFEKIFQLSTTPPITNSFRISYHSQYLNALLDQI